NTIFAFPPSADSQLHSNLPVASRIEVGNTRGSRSFPSTVHLSPVLGSPDAGRRRPTSFQAQRFWPSLGGAPPSRSFTVQPDSVRVAKKAWPARAVGFSSIGVSLPLFWREELTHSILTVLASICVWVNFSFRVRFSRRAVSPLPSRTTVSSSRVDPKVTVDFSPVFGS